MEILDLNIFLEYIERIRSRTINVIKCIPPERMEWSPNKNQMSFSDIIRHIGAIERYMYAETSLGKESSYSGYGKEIMGEIQDLVKFLRKMHIQSIEIFKKLTYETLVSKVSIPSGAKITLWKWLRAMVEHEIHHRGHIYSNLSNIGIKTPPLFGLTSEEAQKKV